MKTIFQDEVNQRLLFPTKPIKSNVAILLGGKAVSGDIARQAALDYLASQIGFKDYFNKIILCGGARIFQPHIYGYIQFVKGSQTQITDFFSPAKEADYMHRILIQNGVAPEDIIYAENQSHNTGENFANIRGFVINNSIQTANIYSVAYMSRRAIETCAWQIPELKSNPVSVYPYGLSRKEWLERWPRTKIKSIITGEYEKVNPANPDNFYAPQRSGKKEGAIFCTPVPRLGN